MTRPRRWSSACLVLLSAFLPLGAADGAEGYLRSPDLHGDTVVFTAEGDLWLSSLSGGVARRLTTHVGTESLAAFSPDGQWVAFTGSYDGNSDVFVVSASGGEPRRLTWHPSSDRVLGWSPDGKQVSFLSNREQPHGSTEIFAVPFRGGDPQKLPLGWAADLDVDPDSGRWAFTRTHGGGTWKRYRGGSAQTIWVGHPEKEDFQQVTTFEGMNAHPMWHGGRVYLLCDQGGTANLWSMAPDGSDRRRHTDFGKWDARSLSMAPDGRIVFTLAADIHLFDPKNDSERTLSIQLPSDRLLTRSRYPQAVRDLTFFDLSPEGDRVMVTTRGEVFSVPVKEGVTLPVTRGSGARERSAVFGPDGEQIAYITDEPGEEEIRTLDAWGRGGPRVVKKAGDSGWHFTPAYSPDGKFLAYGDQTQSLYLVPVEGGNPRLVDRCENGEIRDYDWSPGGRWLAYSKSHGTGYRSVYVYDTVEGKVHRITGDDTHDFGPSWDPDGRYLGFLSDRATNPLLGDRDFQNVNIRPSKMYLALLRDDVENPFTPHAGLPPKDDDSEDEEAEESEEEGESEGAEESDDADSEDKEDDAKEGSGDSKDKAKGKGKSDKKSNGKKGKDDKKPKKDPIEIHFEGLDDRIIAMPVPAGDYRSLLLTKGGALYRSRPVRGMAPEGPGGSSDLMLFDYESKKSNTFVSGAGGFATSANAEKIAIWKDRQIYVVSTASPPGKLGDSKVDLSGIVVELDPREEWSQIYYEGWRRMRDFYWDESLGGVDWKAVRDQYATLLPRLSIRDDLRDLMAEMIGELATSHTYVFGGDQGVSVSRVSVGLLGADLRREGDAFQVERIYRGSPADQVSSPLTRPGVNVKEGDYLLAVNHLPFPSDRPFHAMLEGRSRIPVLLTVNDKPSLEGARDVVVEPMSSDRDLRYSDWVRRNREAVAEQTDGKIGYIHIPDMSTGGLVEFNTWFYPQLRKEGMVVDVRWNGGGFVSQMILERFRRHVLSFDRSRGGSVDYYPSMTLNGPFVVLTNEHAGSDGDIFPAAVQLEELAPVIGKRSWGGVVGIRMDKRFVDGGMLSEPEFAWWDPKLGWELENRGVDPDIVVENMPQDVAKDVDAQLARGIQEVLSLHAKNPPVEPEFGPARRRGRDAYQGEMQAE